MKNQQESLAAIFPKVDDAFQADIDNACFFYKAATTSTNGFSLRMDRLEIRPGQVHCIYGTNGCGKTTLLRSLAGILVPREGMITWTPRARLLPGKDHVLVTQAGPMPHWSVAKNILAPMLNQGMEPAAASSRGATLISLLGLDGLEDRYAHQLSAGQQQRTVLARALSIAPRILLLDEIMSGQSEYWATKIGEILVFYASQGRMVVIVSHDPEWVFTHAGRVTNIVSDSTDAISATQFYMGFNGNAVDWQAYRETRLRGSYAQGLGH